MTDTRTQAHPTSRTITVSIGGGEGEEFRDERLNDRHPLPHAPGDEAPVHKGPHSRVLRRVGRLNHRPPKKLERRDRKALEETLQARHPLRVVRTRHANR